MVRMRRQDQRHGWPIGWILVVCACASLLPTSALALDPHRLPSQYVHTAWGTDEGLPENAVSRLLQTSDGDLWVGTQAGLARFDGDRFVVHDHSNTPALHDDFVRDLVEDASGTLWIATPRGGVTTLRDGRFIHLDAVPDRGGLALAVAHDGSVWIGGYGGLLCLRDGRVVARYTKANGLSGDPVTRLLADGDDLWIATVGGLDRLHAGAIRAYGTRDGLPGNDVVSVDRDRDGAILVHTRDLAAARLVGDRFEPWRIDGVAGIQASFEDRDGNFWFGTAEAGLVRVRDGQVARFAGQDGLASDQVSTIYEDRAGDLWIGTLGSGLHRLRNGSFTTYARNEGLPADRIWSVLEDRNGCLWSATDVGLARTCHDTTKVFSTADGLPSASIRSLWEDDAGGLWVGTATAGLFRLLDDHVVQKLGVPDGLPGSRIGTIFEDREKRLWFAVPGQGLVRYANGTLHVFSKANGLKDDFVYALAEDADGSLWVGSNGGLDRIRGDAVDHAALPPGLPHSAIALLRDPAGVLWIGTPGQGLYRLEKDRLTHYTTTHGLSNDTVNSVLEDADGNLWIGSSKGVYRLAHAGLDAIAHGDAVPLQATVFGRADGMRSDDTTSGSQSSAWRGHDGRLWFATSQGVTVVDPHRLALDDTAPPARIGQVRADDLDVDLGKAMRLAPGTRRVQFRYGASDLAAPERLRFRFRLDGFDTHWIDGNAQRTADYTNLSPGRYLFRVIASSESGQWGSREGRAAFVMAPWFYQTVWFRVAIVIMAFAGLWVIHRFRVGWLKARTAVLEERQRIAGEIHDNLAQSLSGIVFQSEAALLSMERAPGATRAHVESARDLARSGLEQASSSVWNLGSPSANERSLLEALREVVGQLAGGRVEHLRIEASGVAWALPPDTENHVIRIAQEAVSNAIRHGHAGTIAVELAYLPDAMRLEVSDDGAGFTVGNGSAAAQGGFGMTSMRRRADRLRARLDVASTPGQGTHITLAMPRRRTLASLLRRWFGADEKRFDS